MLVNRIFFFSLDVFYPSQKEFLFLAHVSTSAQSLLRVSYCDHSPSVVHFLVYTLASTDINQSAPNLVKIYVTIRSRISLIIGLIRLEGLELFALELKNLLYFVYTLESTNINQSAPNLVKIYTTIRSQMSLIMGLVGSEGLELFALELKSLLYFTLEQLQFLTYQH